MLPVVRSDNRLLGSANVGKRDRSKWKTPGSFAKLKVASTTATYVYLHHEHPTFSKTFLSQLQLCGIDIEVTKAPEPSGCTQHLHHDHLQPYFMDNRYLMEYYREQAKCGREEEVKEESDLLQEIIERKRSAKGTAFECPESSVPVFNWNEDDWTLRLSRGIEKLHPASTVTFSALLGMSFGKVLEIVGVAFGVEKCFLFRGAPDILVQCGGVLCGASTDADVHISSDSEDGAVENCHQRPPLKGYCSMGPPEKLGELIAALHCLVVAKILRRVSKGKEIRRTHRVKGLLVNKTVGVMQCSLSRTGS